MLCYVMTINTSIIYPELSRLSSVYTVTHIGPSDKQLQHLHKKCFIVLKCLAFL